MEKKIAELLYEPKRTFNSLTEKLPNDETKECITTGFTSFHKDLCMTHKKAVASSNRMLSYYVYLSNAAILFEYASMGMIACAAHDNKDETAVVYVEISKPGLPIVWLYLTQEKESGDIKVYDAGAGPEDTIAALAVLAVLSNENIKSAYEEAKKAKNVSAEEYLHKVLTFCDSFLYDFCNGSVEPDTTSGRIYIKKSASDISKETLKQAYRTGMLKDTTSQFSMGNSVPELELFRGIEPREGSDENTNARRSSESDTFSYADHIIHYEWGESQKDRIRPISFLDDFVPTNTFYKIIKKMDLRIRKNMSENVLCGITDPKIVRNDYVNMLFYGDPGTGKTALANAIAACTGMPIYEVTFNEDSEDDEFEGKNKIVEGKLSFVETAFLEGYANGGILLLEEINLARANIFTSVLNQAMEYPYVIKKNGYERIQRHPFTVIIGTMNLETEGTTLLNSACAQRFTSKYLVEEMSDEEMIRVLKKRGYKAGDVRYVYAQYKKLRKSLRESERERKLLKEISIRQCIDALNAIEEGVDAREAVIDSLYGALAVKNKQIADKYNAGMFQTMTNYRKA